MFLRFEVCFTNFEMGDLKVAHDHHKVCARCSLMKAASRCHRNIEYLLYENGLIVQVDLDWSAASHQIFRRVLMLDFPP